jgi:hypothetical protein
VLAELADGATGVAELVGSMQGSTGSRSLADAWSCRTDRRVGSRSRAAARGQAVLDHRRIATFLMSDDNSFMTAAKIVADGGFL